MKPVDRRWVTAADLGMKGGRSLVCDASGVPDATVTSFPPEPWRSATVPPPVADGDLHFTCPRCAREAESPSYGPCPTCRDELRRTMAGEARDVDEVDYVPKMNVTPNAVAVKE